jgi:hypothetical protein
MADDDDDGSSINFLNDVHFLKRTMHMFFKDLNIKATYSNRVDFTIIPINKSESVEVVLNSSGYSFYDKDQILRSVESFENLLTSLIGEPEYSQLFCKLVNEKLLLDLN